MPEALKEKLFNPQTVDTLCDCIAAVYPPLNRAAFTGQVFNENWPNLELKERMRWIAICLHDHLPASYPQALGILRQAAATNGLGGFPSLVFCDFVEMYGLEDWEASLPALGQFTCLGSAEFAVRPFIVADPDRMLRQMYTWSLSENQHHRRLASEGCRPRLPWGIGLPALKADPSPILPILENLKRDPEEYVRRSVANNLNDITKDHPPVVIELLRRWQSENLPDFEEIASRALRSLIKDGDPAALGLMGFAHGGAFTVEDFQLTPQRIPMYGEVNFSFSLRSTGSESQNLVIDYVVHQMRANGQQTPKVFKLTQKVLAPGESCKISKSHSFRAVTTRRYYPGAQAIEIQVNGVVCARGELQMED